MQYAVILAAGMGSRMKSHTIKVLHPILGKPMVQWSVDTALEAGFHPVVVVGHQAEQVKASLADYHQQVSFALQPEAKGTGHAVLCALPELPSDVQKGEGTVLVFFGDTPLFTAATLQQLVSYHSEGGYDVTFLTAELPDAGSYGRLVRDSEGRALRIVEAANASSEELRIQEFNTGAAVFDLAWLHKELPSFQPHPPKGEIYLTDALEVAAQTETAAAKVLADVNEANGVNTRVDLAEATRILQDRIVHQHMVNGVGFADPRSVTVEPSVVIHPDTWIERGVILRGETLIESDVVIDAYSVVEDCDIQQGVHIAPFSHCHQAIIAQSATVGPFARLREGSLVGEGAKVGNFVEMKKTQLGPGAKANHLTYLGDARVGAKANIGAGTITCNYNGFTKSKTTIGAGAFIGSNSALVAPVIVGPGAIVGAGSVITKDVPADDIAIARGEQRNLSQAAVKFRSRYQ